MTREWDPAGAIDVGGSVYLLPNRSRAAEPAGGYELTRRFAESMAHVWPAGHGQIYPEPARLAEDGLIEQTGTGPRGRRTYSATTDGVAALRHWLRSTEPDNGC